MIATALLFLASLFVAYSNGANDNFKGVATLYGSNAATYRSALTLATITTFAGSLASLIFAASLVKAFSGHGLVPDEIASSGSFLLAVGLGAGGTVLLATVLGFPVSTTHGLTGALVGAGFAAAGSAHLNLHFLGGAFVTPLLLSPIIAFALAFVAYRLFRTVVARSGITKQTCVCVGPAQFVPLTASAPSLGETKIAAAMPGAIELTVADSRQCVQKYNGHMLGIRVQALFDGLHYLSAGAVSFARGLNDTPKIVGLLAVASALNIRYSLAAIAIAMAVGGLLNARKVARTMSHKIARMDDEQALVANLVTAGLVLFASRLGVPVSTTHVSVGAITGIGTVNGTADTRVVTQILLSWVLTLPIAAVLAGFIYALRVLV